MTLTLVSAASEQPGKSRPGTFLLSSLPGWMRGLVNLAVGMVRPDRVVLLPATRPGWAEFPDGSSKIQTADRSSVDRDGRVSRRKTLTGLHTGSG